MGYLIWVGIHIVFIVGLIGVFFSADKSVPIALLHIPVESGR